MRKLTLAMWALLALGAVVPSAAAGQGSLYHERTVGRSAQAARDSCASAAVGERCTNTILDAVQLSDVLKDPDDVAGTVHYHDDCVDVAQLLAIKTSALHLTDLAVIRGHACGSASVSLHVSASLGNARVEAEVPVQKCDRTTYPETCVDTTTPVRFSVAWEPSGDLFRSPTGNPIDRVTTDSERCLYHYLPYRFVNATVTGEITGLLDALGEPDVSSTYIADDGEIWVGTNHDCLD